MHKNIKCTFKKFISNLETQLNDLNRILIDLQINN